MTEPHWLLKPGETWHLLGTNQVHLNQLSPNLVFIRLPGGGHRYPRLVIEALVEFLAGRKVTARLVRTFWTRFGARLFGQVEEEYSKKLMVQSLKGRITTAGIVAVFGVSESTVNTWKQANRLTPQKKGAQNWYSLLQISVEFPLHNPTK